jgi:hypothetical protein
MSACVGCGKSEMPDETRPDSKERINRANFALLGSFAKIVPEIGEVVEVNGPCSDSATAAT